MIFGPESYDYFTEPCAPLGAPWDITPSVPAGAGGEWSAIRHGDLIDVIVDEAEARGWLSPGTVYPGRYCYTNSGACMAASIGLPELGFGGKDFCYHVGVINSNNRRRALQVYGGVVIGGKWAVVTDDLTNGRMIRHTDGTAWRDEIRRMLDVFGIARHGIAETLQSYQLPITEFEEARLLVLAARQNILPWTGIGKINGDSATVYDLLRVVSLAIRLGPPYRQLDALYNFGRLLPLGTNGKTRLKFGLESQANLA